MAPVDAQHHEEEGENKGRDEEGVCNCKSTLSLVTASCFIAVRDQEFVSSASFLISSTLASLSRERGFKWYKKGINKLTNIKCVLLDHFHCQLKCAVHTFMENEKHSLITFLGTKKLESFLAVSC